MNKQRQTHLYILKELQKNDKEKILNAAEEPEKKLQARQTRISCCFCCFIGSSRIYKTMVFKFLVKNFDPRSLSLMVIAIVPLSSAAV